MPGILTFKQGSHLFVVRAVEKAATTTSGVVATTTAAAFAVATSTDIPTTSCCRPLYFTHNNNNNDQSDHCSPPFFQNWRSLSSSSSTPNRSSLLWTSPYFSLQQMGLTATTLTSTTASTSSTSSLSLSAFPFTFLQYYASAFSRWTLRWWFTRTPLSLSPPLPPSDLSSSEELADNTTTTTTTTKSFVLASSPASTVLSFQHLLLAWIQRWYQRIWKFVLVATRTTEVVLRLSPLLVLTPLAWMSSSVQFGSPAQQIQHHHHRHHYYFYSLENLAWRYAVFCIQELGPVAIKFCQWMATRRDIFPPEVCDRLSVLHDHGYPHAWSYTQQALQEAFGDDYERQGLVVTPHDVVGCGSAAQVYKGRLRVGGRGVPTSSSSTSTADHNDKNADDDDNDTDTDNYRYREVAVKVLHPRFQEMVDRDLEFIAIVADFLNSLPFDTLRMLNLPRAVEEFSLALHNQSDLTIEANNLRQFRINFYGSSSDAEHHSSIVFPQPIEGWTSSKVLVEDYVHDATPIADFLMDSSKAGMETRRELAAPLLRAFLKMVFYDNFIHGDLHPGNVLVTTTMVAATPSSKWSIFPNSKRMDVESDDVSDMVEKRSIVFLDAGIAISLSSNDQRNLIDLFRAVIFNNGEKAGRLMVERAKYERCSQVEGCVDSFSRGVGDIVCEFHDNRKEGLTLGAVRIGSLLSRVLDLCRTHGVEIDPAMASVVISTLVLEGLGRSLSPDLDLLTFAKPFVMGLGRSMTRASRL